MFDIVLFAALVLGISLIAVMVIAFHRMDNGVMDIFYGLGFVILLWTIASLWQEWSVRQVLVLVLVTLWGMRLALRIFLKNRGKPEDFRYRAWREAWTKRGMLYFFLRSLFQIYLLQGAVILVVSLPVLVVFSQVQLPMGWLNWLGLSLWGIGFFFEVVGDWQLDRFVRSPDNKGKIMQSGLWRYTRHPNYFGEAVMWWGLALFVSGLPWSSLAFASPLLITYLLTRVSGIPLLEARWVGHPDWEAYKRKTSVFIPWFPKRTKTEA
jgi:steroid 5-alpha reductase family enzyme